MHGACDSGSGLVLKFRSGAHGLRSSVYRHRGKEGRKKCQFCHDECDNASHVVLWECEVYTTLEARTLCVSLTGFSGLDL